jgi:threonyl-tRNA synthetase
MLTFHLPDGSRREFPGPVSGADIAGSIGAGLKRAALAMKVNDVVLDLSTVLDSDAKIEIVTVKTPESLDVIRHSTAHVLAKAVQRLWPGTQITIGPVIKDGFYYDFSFPEGVKLSDQDFPKIEAEMRALIKADEVFQREVLKRSAAVQHFTGLGEHFKVEIIKDLPESEDISVYHLKEWQDLCRGPHVPSTGKLGHFRLMSLAGAYWRGDEKNPQLTRIYATAWQTDEDLKLYLARLEEAKRRDHRVLGKQLDLFSFHEETPANAFFHPNGALLYNQLVQYMRGVNERYGFREVGTPLIMNVDLWHRSGHYQNYAENMYFTKVDDHEAAVKPMNCPGHCLIYKNKRHSYRELPVRVSEFGRVHRHERSGVTHGLFRVRTFVQDDAHVFCRVDQVADEIRRILRQIDEVYSTLGFKNYRLELSTRPAKSIGSDAMWELAENTLQSVLDDSGRTYKINPGDGAFYGPKIDFHLVDSLERTWQCGTVQLDFSMPERFELEYQGDDDKAHQPVMIHRAVLGSLERFLGIFIENTAGHFPLWIAFEQIRVVAISDKHIAYGEQLTDALRMAGLRVQLDQRNERLNYKIRDAQMMKIPFMLVIGDQEMESETVSPRQSDGTQLEKMSVSAFITLVKEKIAQYQ